MLRRETRSGILGFKMTNAERTKSRKVAEMLHDATGDAEWLTVDLEQLAGWYWDPCDNAATGELVTQVLDQSVEPCHCKRY